MNELSVQLKCVLLRGGLEIWLEEERITKLEKLMETAKYIKLNGSVIATLQIAGIFTPEHMDEFKRLKQGQWHCMKGNQWHDKSEKCNCKDFRLTHLEEKLKEVQNKCGLCKEGIKIIIDDNNISTAIPCKCSKNLLSEIKKLRNE